MIMFHENLISHLCDAHLKGMWANGWEIWEIIREDSHPQQVKLGIMEFMQCPLELAFRLHLVYKEAKKRGIKLHRDVSPYDASQTPFQQWFKEMRLYNSSFSLTDQKLFLKKKGCKCRI